MRHHIFHSKRIFLTLFATLVLCSACNHPALRAIFRNKHFKGDVTFCYDKVKGTIIDVNIDEEENSANSTFTWDVLHSPWIFGKVCSKNREESYHNLAEKVGTTSKKQTHDIQENLIYGRQSVFGRALQICRTHVDYFEPCYCGNIEANNVRTGEARFSSSFRGFLALREAAGRLSLPTLLFGSLTDISKENGNRGVQISVHKGNAHRDENNKCKHIGDELFTIYKNISFSSARTQQLVMTLPNEMLTTLEGRTIVLKDKETKTSLDCANIKLYNSRRSDFKLSMDIVKGRISFLQKSPYDPTLVNIQLSGLALRFKTWELREHEIGYKVTKFDDVCEERFTGKMFDPLKNEGPLGHVNFDLVVGNLTEKYGSLKDRNTLELNNVVDFYLPLFGKHSVLGRSLVLITEQGNPSACANIQFSNEGTFVAYFRDPVVGHISFIQTDDGEFSSAIVSGRLAYKDFRTPTTGQPWYIHTISAENKDSYVADLCHRLNWRPGTWYDNLCSTKSGTLCQVENMSGKFKGLDIGSHDPAKPWQQFHIVDSQLTSQSQYAEKHIIIELEGQEFACAIILKEKPISLIAHDWKQNTEITGSVTFEQAARMSPSHINIYFNGLQGKIKKFHVHRLPVPNSGPDFCSADAVAGPFNPFDIPIQSCPPMGAGTSDEYEVGDLSGKFGDILGLNNYSGTFQDATIQLFGPQSIVGRSVVLHRANGSRVTCSRLARQLPVKAKLKKAMARFNGILEGSVYMEQVIHFDFLPSETTVIIDLAFAKPYQDYKSLQHKWHVHERPVLDNGKCGKEYTGGPYNPFNVNATLNYQEVCSPQFPQRCEVGDVAGKSRPYDIGAGRMFVTVQDLPLAGPHSVIGKSVMVHEAHKGAKRLACATLKEISSSEKEKAVRPQIVADGCPTLPAFSHLISSPCKSDCHTTNDCDRQRQCCQTFGGCFKCIKIS